MAENIKSNSNNWTVLFNGEPFSGKFELENIKFEEEEDTLEDFEPYNIIFQPERKTTIVIWNDGSKTVVKCHEDEFSKEFGFAMALAKKIYGRSEFLRLIKNASVQHTVEKKKKESSKTEDYDDQKDFWSSGYSKAEPSELDSQPKRRMTVQEACKKCFEVAEAADDIYDVLSKIGKETSHDTKSKYSE